MGEHIEIERRHKKETDLGDYHVVLEGIEIDARNKQHRLFKKLAEDKEFRKRFEEDTHGILRKEMNIIIPKGLLPEKITLSEELKKMEEASPGHSDHTHHGNHSNHSHTTW